MNIKYEIFMYKYHYQHYVYNVEIKSPIKMYKKKYLRHSKNTIFEDFQNGKMDS